MMLKFDLDNISLPLGGAFSIVFLMGAIMHFVRADGDIVTGVICIFGIVLMLGVMIGTGGISIKGGRY